MVNVILQFGKSWKAGKRQKIDCGNEENQTENHAFVSLKMFGLIYSLPFTFGSGQFLHVKLLFDIKCQKILQQKHRAANSHDQTVALFTSLPPCSLGVCCRLTCSHACGVPVPRLRWLSRQGWHRRAAAEAAPSVTRRVM